MEKLIRERKKKKKAATKEKKIVRETAEGERTKQKYTELKHGVS